MAFDRIDTVAAIESCGQALARNPGNSRVTFNLARAKAGYLEQVRREAQRLVDQGYLLAEDLELVVDHASRRYQLLAAAREPGAADD